MNALGEQLAEASRTLVRVTGTLARFCDRAEHNEGTERDIVATAGAELRGDAVHLLRVCGADAVDSYASRLARLESRHPLAGAGLFEADETIRHAKTWRAIQQGQARHDAVYHPDVNGLAKIDQLRHYTLHLAKLAWLLQEAAGVTTADDDLRDRITDVLVFGVKLATVCGQLLPDEPVDLIS